MFDPLARASPVFPRRPDGELTPVADPLADLLLSAVAIIVLAMIAIIPTLPRHHTSQGDPQHSIGGFPADSSFRMQGREVEPLVATAAGLMIASRPARLIPVGSIFFDQGLVATLERMRRADETIVLLIEPDGFETAFQFEVIANRHGPKRMRQLRLEAECRPATSEQLPLDCAGIDHGERHP
jgi:hypothetical protein